MSNRADRRAKLKQRMQNDAANRDKGSGRQALFDLSNFDDVNWFKAKKGKNEIDILPFEVTTGNDPMGAAIGEDQYKLEYWQHNNIGPKDDRVICLSESFGKPCPVCEARKEMLDAGADWKDDEVKALGAKRRCIYNVIDLNETDKGVQLFEQSHFKFEKELFAAAEYKNPDFICFADIEEGYTVTFRGSEETFNKNKFIEPKDFDFETRDAYEESIYDDVFPLDAMLIIPTYDEVQALFLGVEPEKEEPKKEKSTRKAKGGDRASAKEGREAPARGRKRKAAPVEESEESEEVDHSDDIPDCYAGHTYGEDWDNTSDCEGCDHFDACADKYETLEKEKEEVKEKPATRRRNKRR